MELLIIGMALLEWLYYNENYNSNHAQHGDFIKPAIPNMRARICAILEFFQQAFADVVRTDQ